MTIFRTIFCGVFCALVSVPVFAGVGSADTRQYADWSSDMFSRYVSIGSVKYSLRCTGQYVAPNLVLTAAHCYNGKQDVGRTEYMTSPLVNETIKGKVIAIGDFKDINSTPTTDWALVLIENEKYYYPKDNFFNPDNLDTKKEYEPVINAGFGWARIVSDAEIAILRAAFQSVAAGSRQVQIQDVQDALNRAMKDNNMEPFREKTPRLKFDNCNVVIDTDCRKVCKQDSNACKNICGNRASLTGKSRNDWPQVLGTTCDSWGGNSGGAYFSRNSGKLISICSKGHDDFDDARETDYALSAVVLNKVINDARAKYPPKNAVNTATPVSGTDNSTSTAPVESVPDNTTTTTPLAETVDQNSEAQTGEEQTGDMSADYMQGAIQNATDNVVAIVNSGNISDADVLNIVDGLTTIQVLEERYKKAYEKEHSLENRMLGGLTMAATGIGGMQLAQGLAEQNADKKAEQDMAAYLATFQCKIGDKGGKSYSGGEMGIEVAGANQLTGLYQQYVDLAASLKERKTALGMAPGIESQVVMDKANMGLYDAEGGKGIENGTYASLYRASRGNETDANKLADQQNTSATRVKGGAIAAGVGVVGGIVGNMLINGDKGKVTEADCKKAGGTLKDDKCDCPGKRIYKDGKCQDISIESAVSNTGSSANVAPDQTSTTPDQSTDEESTGDDETVSEDKIKECVQYINENVHFVGPFKEHNCERLAIKLDDSLFLALTNEEAAALSTVWDWGCSSVDPYKLYGAGSHDIDKDACTTVENMKNFVANSKKTCDEYSGYETQNMVDWTVCLPKSWGPEVLDDDTDDATTEEQEPVASIESQRIKGGACLEQDLPKNATKGHYITTGRNNLDCKDGIKCSCAAQECGTGFTVKKVNGKSQGYCVKK